MKTHFYFLNLQFLSKSHKNRYTRSLYLSGWPNIFSDFCDIFPARDGRPKFSGRGLFYKTCRESQTERPIHPKFESHEEGDGINPEPTQLGQPHYAIARNCTFSSFILRLRNSPLTSHISLQMVLLLPQMTGVCRQWRL